MGELLPSVRMEQETEIARALAEAFCGYDHAENMVRARNEISNRVAAVVALDHSLGKSAYGAADRVLQGDTRAEVSFTAEPWRLALGAAMVGGVIFLLSIAAMFAGVVLYRWMV